MSLSLPDTITLRDFNFEIIDVHLDSDGDLFYKEFLQWYERLL